MSQENELQSRLLARMTAPIIGVSAVLLVIAFAAVWYVHSSQRTLSELLSSNVNSVRRAQDLEISLREVHIEFDRFLITGDRQHLESIPRLKKQADDALRGAEESAGTLKEQALMRRVRSGYEHFFREYDRLSHAQFQTGMYTKVSELIETVLTKEILEPTREYLRFNEGLLVRSAEANRELSRHLSIGVIGLGVCGAAGGLLAGWVIATSVRRSIQTTEDVLRTTADQLDQAARSDEWRFAEARDAGALQRVTQSATLVLSRLKQTERDALRAEQLAWVGQMAAGIAHEIRNPLMTIKLLIQAATDPRRQGLQPRDIQVLEEEILRLEQIISTFLDFARPPRLEKRVIEPSTLLENCLDGIRARAELQSVEIRRDWAGATHPIQADGGQLKQVIYNLVFNALDVLPQGGTVNVSAREGSDHQSLVVRISDNGPGLEPSVAEKVFEPFISTKETGMGLGLSISRRIVEAHGGTIEAANAPNGGAVFTLQIPYAMTA